MGRFYLPVQFSVYSDGLSLFDSVILYMASHMLAIILMQTTRVLLSYTEHFHPHLQKDNFRLVFKNIFYKICFEEEFMHFADCQSMGVGGS